MKSVSLKHRFARKKSLKVERMEKESADNRVSTEGIVSTDKEKVGTDKSKVST
ncbi:hypothetical protein Tco_0587108, partial [Tanacetum coccineum]